MVEHRIPPLLLTGVAVMLLAVSFYSEPPAVQDKSEPPNTGRELFVEACAACHGSDGKGRTRSEVGFQVPLPDFTDCSFATREPDGDWLAVAHEGGPARGFNREMPAFGDALSDDDLQKIIDYIRMFCVDDNWPRGELNIPRALVTEKAYVEDEAVLTTSVDVENETAVENKFVYEKRFGSRNQVELVIPISFSELESGGWSGGRLGDVALGIKRALYHNLQSGSIFSVTGEVKFPTSEGATFTVFEPFVSFGQILPADGFLQFQGGGEAPLKANARVDAFWRGVLGKSFSSGRFGRSWSPMVELLGSREMISGAPTHWDVVPQMQVTLNTRQHIMANIGIRIPVDDPTRDTRIVVYLLWDWFDGGLMEGW